LKGKCLIQNRIFWQNATGGLLNHADFFDTVAENVRIEVGDIEALEKGLVKLKSGIDIPTDAILCGTGWQSSLLFFTEEQRQNLGLPHLIAEESPQDKERWSKLQVVADEKVVSTFPALANPPEHFEHSAISTPFRLYNNIVPISPSDSDRSIVFIGQICVGNYFPAIECQSMWATAYMDGHLSLPSLEEQEKEVALFTAWNKRRYLEKGAEGNNITFELVAYCDSLLGQLGLRSYRKGWFRDIFSPLRAADFNGLKEEYLSKYGAKVESSGN
jgi:dimethylaniline monooxygenase (N-oxide forming)